MTDTPDHRPERHAVAAAVARLRPGGLFGESAGWWVIVSAIVLAGAMLRFYALDWDQPDGASAPIQLHPDERFISFVSNDIDWPGFGSYFDTANSPLNPYNADKPSFVYGTFPLFAARAVSTLVGDNPSGPGNSYGADVVWGRRLTAAVDTLTIVLVIALGTVLFSRAAGAIAGGAYAFAVFPIQLAHFWTVDPWVTFFATAAVLFSVFAVNAVGPRTFATMMAIAGLCVGLGLASKVTAFPIALAPALATVIRMGLRDFPALGIRWRGVTGLPAGPATAQPGSQRGAWLYEIAILCLAAWVAILAFRVAQPYAFAGPNFWDLSLNQQWLDDLQRERELQGPDSSYPPFVQFATATPFVTPLQNLVIWGLGPALGIASWLAMGAATFLIFKRREAMFLMPVALALSIFVFQGERIVAFMRYFAPMYPMLALFAGWAAMELWRGGWRTVTRRPAFIERAGERLRVSSREVAWLARGAVIVIAVATVWWALAFMNIYREEHPRITASEWIYENIEPGSAVTSEIWDDALPLDLPGGRSRGMYVEIPTDPYRTDSIETIHQLVFGPGDGGRGGLVDADYVMISSHRIRESVVHLEREYPATIRYYDLLESGELGFERVAHFEVRPSFLGISVNDASAEEAFTVYDHPEVSIYQKRADFDPAVAFAMLMEANPQRAIPLTIGQGHPNGLHFTASEAEAQQAGGTFSDIVSDDGFASRLPALWWLVWLQAAAFALLPALTWLLRALPDRGYGLSKVLGLTAVALPTWLLVAWGAADFSGGLAWGIWFTVVMGGVASGALLRRSLLAAARERWRSWLTLELIFLAAFLLFLSFRWWNPDLWHPFRGGEKPMELAYFTAVIRSTQLPPIDPWFAGGSMNYYYMGWFFMAVPVRALQIVPEVAFNLAVPTFAALAAVTAASTAHNLVALAPRFAEAARRGARVPVLPAALVAILGAVLLAGIGNLDALDQTVERFQSLNTWGLFEGVPVLGGGVGIAGGVWNAIFEGGQLPAFDWWRSSRVYVGSFAITEFPFWTFLFADLHPHLMALPFFGTVVALAVAYAVTVHRGLGAQPWFLAALLGLMAGLMRTVHTWDFPTVVLITAGAIVLGQLYARGRWDLRFRRLAGHGALAAVFLLVPFAPYAARSEVFEAGAHLAEETTPANQFFAHFGIFVVIALAFLVLRYVEVLRSRPAGGNLFLLLVSGRWELVAMSVFLAGIMLVTWPFGLTVIALAAIAILFLLNLLWLEWRAAERDIPRVMVTAIFALAFAIAAGVDVVTINNDIVRMNTVFKFSLQAWQLFALASAYAAWYVLSALWDIRGLQIRPRPGRRVAATAVTAIGALFIFAGLLYPLSGTGPRLSERFTDASRGLNGFAYLETGTFVDGLGTPDPDDDIVVRTADDAALAWWLRENVEGSPVIVETPGPLYHWNGRMTVLTGLPTVIGWDWHQTQQRWAYQHLIQRRMVETQIFYDAPEPLVAEQFLLTYDVQYVIVGALERAHGTDQGVAKFANMEVLTEVFRNGDDVIYEVDKDLLLTRAIERTLE